MSIPTQRLSVSAAGRTWLLDRVGDLEARWAALGQGEFGDDERIPYWCELWPASLLLCQWLAENQGQVQGRSCLDVGCGLGLTAIVAAAHGGRVLGLDYEEEALGFARRNATLNGVRAHFAVMDWRAPAVRPGSMDLLLGGDIVYERRFFEPLRDLFWQALAPGGRAWLAEPKRSVSSDVWPRLAKHGFAVAQLCTREVPVEGYAVTVNLWELRKPG